MTRYYLQNDNRFYYFAAIRDAVRRGGGKQIRTARQPIAPEYTQRDAYEAIHGITPAGLTVATWSAKGSAVEAIESELRMIYPYVKQGYGLPLIKEKDW